MADLSGKILTFKQFAMQWEAAPSRFEVNVFNFETDVADAAVDIFKKSFYLKRFNSSSTDHWAPTTRKNPILVETGQLRDSIKRMIYSGSKGKGVIIYTNPTYRASFDKRHQRTYGEIHNRGIGGIEQRQFMGHSDYLEEYIITHSKKIFQGFPT